MPTTFIGTGVGAGGTLTAAVIIRAARDILKDTQAESRWSDIVLIRYMNAGQRELFEARPYLLLKSDDTLDTITEPTALGSTVTSTLDNTWALPLASFTAAQALKEDDADTENAQRASRLMKNFYDRVRPNG